MDLNDLAETFTKTRMQSTKLCKPLLIEDYVIQSSEDVSPPKWHLAHTTWFFEYFILLEYFPKYRPFDTEFIARFNSYYNGIGKPYLRRERGFLSRPSVHTILNYRNHVDLYCTLLIEDRKVNAFLEKRFRLGIEHERQHIELLLMDIKHNFFQDPSYPAYDKREQSSPKVKENTLDFIELKGGLTSIGYDPKDALNTNASFCFDNELPKHQVFMEPFKIANRLVTNGEYLAFIEASGYQNPLYWLADGWDLVQKNQWKAPLYWVLQDNHYAQFTLQGLVPLNLEEPVTHISYFEAEAYATFKGCRLPNEEEWEEAVKQLLTNIEGNFLESNRLKPIVNTESTQFFGNLWEWTSSPYRPYPGFKAFQGKLGEYNEKFMNNQYVLRGGSFATPIEHIRVSYRNFFAPDKRWPFCGIRLAT